MNEELVDEIYAVLVERFGVTNICIKKYGKRGITTWKEFILLAMNSTNTQSLYTSTGFDINGKSFSNYFTNNFSNITKDKNGVTWKVYFLYLIGKKLCPRCGNVKALTEFSADKSNNLLGVHSSCKSCDIIYSSKYKTINRDSVLEYGREYEQAHRVERRAKNARYRADLKGATPKWADQEKIKEMYKNCPEGSHVDHWAPLRGELVCGLHVHQNLQYLTAAENLAKSNKFEVC